MPNIRRFLSCRWLLGFVGIVALLFGLAMLHPYPRQSLFGPTIRGKPRCIWEAEIQRFVPREESWFEKSFAWFRADRHDLTLPEVFDNAEMLPLVLDMLDDPDPRAQQFAMNQIAQFSALQDRSALPRLRLLLATDALDVRLSAARAIWKIDKDKHVLQVFVKLLDDSDPGLRSLGMMHVASLAGEAPELYPHLAGHVNDSNDRVRSPIMFAMQYFGKKGVPILIVGLNDPSAEVRQAAVDALEELGPVAVEAIPALEARLKDVDATVRRTAPLALQAIDRERFKHLKGWRK